MTSRGIGRELASLQDLGCGHSCPVVMVVAPEKDLAASSNSGCGCHKKSLYSASSIQALRLSKQLPSLSKSICLRGLNYMQISLQLCQNLLTWLVPSTSRLTVVGGATGTKRKLLGHKCHSHINTLFPSNSSQSTNTCYHCQSNTHSSQAVLSLARFEWDQMKMVIYF